MVYIKKIFNLKKSEGMEKDVYVNFQLTLIKRKLE